MFNEQQLEAINTVDGTIQVISAAGSGKSTVLVERIYNLVNNHNIQEEEILAISFTNASAEDLKKKLSKKGLSRVSVGTFHSICKDILEKNGYTNLFNSPNIYTIKREIEAKTGEKDINIEDITSWISYQKSYMIDPEGEFEEKDSIYGTRVLRKAYQIYEDYCKKNNMYDFDSWLINTYKLCYMQNVSKWKYILVDEAQDLNLVQHKLVDKFCSTNNIFLVGDFSQCIYEFRGSLPQLFKDFDGNHPGTKVINMNTNYRSCNNIVEAANKFIRSYNSDYDNYKDSVANIRENGIIECNYFSEKTEEAVAVGHKVEKLLESGVEPKDIAILYRNNSNSDCIESILKQKNIEYVVSNNNSFFDKKEIKGILSILKLIIDSTNDEAFEVVFKDCRFYPTTYYQGSLVSTLVRESGKHDCSLYEAFMDHRWEKGFERKNAQIFIDYMNRLKIQNEKKLSVVKIIENIVKMFKIKEYIEKKYDYSSIQDKLDSIDNLKKFSTGYKDINSFISFCSSNVGIKKRNNKNAVQLCTIHKSKGLEWDNVFLIGLEDEKFPSNRASEESEARLMYVAVTRPRKNLYVSSIGCSDFYKRYGGGLN